jgi:hypothetical protein
MPLHAEPGGALAAGASANPGCCCGCGRRGLPCALAGGLHRALLLAASAAADTADGLKLLLPLLAKAGCIPALCRAPGGVCAWRSLDCCGVLPPSATEAKCDRP